MTSRVRRRSNSPDYDISSKGPLEEL